MSNRPTRAKLLWLMAFVVSMAGDPSPSHAAQGRAASADGVAIAYEAHGAGTPALVFVHGWSCDRTYWKGQLEPLGRRYRVVAIDLAGHGESGTNRQAWTIAAFGADVAAVVEKLGLERVTLVGHSMGGDVIVEAARRLRGRVAGLVWVDVFDRASYLKQWANGFDPDVITYWDMRDQRINVVGDVALVGATNRWVRVRDGAESVGMTCYTDTYVRSEASRLCVLAQLTPVAPQNYPADDTVVVRYLRGVRQYSQSEA